MSVDKWIKYLSCLIWSRFYMTKQEKIKTTILMDKTLKKLAQVYGIQNDMSLGDVIEKALKKVLLEKE